MRGSYDNRITRPSSYLLQLKIPKMQRKGRTILIIYEKWFLLSIIPLLTFANVRVSTRINRACNNHTIIYHIIHEQKYCTISEALCEVFLEILYRYHYIISNPEYVKEKR
jgi:hypothetical protein